MTAPRLLPQTMYQLSIMDKLVEHYNSLGITEDDDTDKPCHWCENRKWNGCAFHDCAMPILGQWTCDNFKRIAE